MRRSALLSLRSLAVLASLAGCNFAPDYHAPDTAAPAAFKEDDHGWAEARPSDDAPRGPWWQMYHDPKLNALEDDVTNANQNLKIALAQYEEARAAAEVARAAYFPIVTANASATRQQTSMNVANKGGTTLYNDYILGAGLNYEIDVWGKVRNAVSAAESRATASQADIGTVGLSLHAELAADYFALRGDDAMQQVLDKNVEVDQKALELTKNRFQGGVSPEADFDQAQTQLQNAKTQAADIRLQRAQLEHAIAVLTGRAPAEFKLEEVPLADFNIPAINPGLPSALLERRPDIAAAERRTAAANADIGVARAAYFPDFSLSGMFGFESATPAAWLEAPSHFWSLGPSAVLTLFDAGRIESLSDEARAAYDEAAATYRQTVLTAYQEVEDNLAALHQLEDESESQHTATAAAERSLKQEQNLYRGGAVTYLDVATSENTALVAELAEINIRMRLLTASVQLVKALGGGWQPAAQ
jgi:NodT family efflux transporter outer membrane factor (OMF) lipoprotein